MKKKFDSVKYQRKTREELGRKYTSNRESFLRQLRERFGGPMKKSRKNKISI